MGSVSVRDLRKNYGAVPVLHGVSIDIADGEFVSLVGPSGCGKSTLLRMIAGLEDITSGEISIGRRVVNDLPPKNRDIAMVFQSYALYPHMTVAENMGFSLKMLRVDKQTTRERVIEVAAILGLTDQLDRFPKQLSGGQRQRVAMGRAIVRSPEVFLFDEPLSNLDAKLRVQMRSEIKQNHNRLQTTTIYVTHDQIEAMTMADRIVVMHDGLIEQVGTPLDLYDNPSNQFVAGFIGSPAMNFVEGVLEGEVLVLASGEKIELGRAPGHGEGRAVTLGIRPEYFQLAPEGLAMQVVTVEPTGSETQVVMRYAGQDLVGVFRERVSANPGEMLHVRVIPERLHFFAGDSGVRLVA